MQNGLLIARLRIKNGVTQAKMAEFLNISIKTYKLLENGIVPISLEDLNTLSNFFDVSINSLLNLTTNTSNSNVFKDIDYKYLKFCLLFVRKRKRVRQADLAREFNISVNAISGYERNPKSVTISYLYSFAKKFNISIDYICGKTLDRKIASNKK